MSAPAPRSARDACGAWVQGAATVVLGGAASRAQPWGAPTVQDRANTPNPPGVGELGRQLTVVRAPGES